MRPDVRASIAKTLQETRLAPELLKIEVSNLAAVDDPKALKAALEELDEAGVSLSLDDLEAATASEHALDDLPFQMVKVHLHEAPTPEAIQALMKAVADARARNLRVVAKRVETADHLRLLRTLDIQGAQGYALGPAVRAAEFAALLGDAGLSPRRDQAAAEPNDARGADAA